MRRPGSEDRKYRQNDVGMVPRAVYETQIRERLLGFLLFLRRGRLPPRLAGHFASYAAFFRSHSPFPFPVERKLFPRVRLFPVHANQRARSRASIYDLSNGNGRVTHGMHLHNVALAMPAAAVPACHGISNNAITNDAR